ncbi:MAG: iron ABC transporter permease, partial [Pseudomonadota bacterium]
MAERIVFSGLILAVLLLSLASLAIGPVTLEFADVVSGFVGSGDAVDQVIIRDIRLPRTILALLVGAILGLSGAALQGLVRNPLASPSLFGAPSMAAFFASGAIAFSGTTALSFLLPFFGIAGALISVSVLLILAGRAAGTITLILAGIALSTFAGAATSLILNLAPNPFAALEVVFWLLGSLEDRSMVHVAMVAPFIAIGAALLLWRASSLKVLTLGEEAAHSLGVSISWLRWRIVVGVAMGVGAAVSVTGSIGFIGLAAPHLVRSFFQHDPAKTLIPSAFAGAALLLAADIAVRIIPSSQPLKVGVLTALIGVPFFLGIVWKSRHRT